MRKYEYYPNPRTDGDTGIYMKEDRVDPNLVILVVTIGIAGCAVVGAYLWGKAKGKDVTLKQLAVKYNIVDDEK